MNIIDLSHTFSSKMPVTEGVSPPVYRKIGDVKAGDLYELTVIENHVCHIGTHIDCSAHMCPEGYYIQEREAGFWMGKGKVIDCRAYPEGSTMGMEILANVNLDETEFLLLYCGWDRRWTEPEAYYGKYPVITQELADYLGRHPKVRGLGVEMNSVDKAGDSSQIIHKTFLKYNKTIIECLKNMEVLLDKDFLFQALPLKINNAEGSPVRAVAILE